MQWWILTNNCIILLIPLDVRAPRGGLNPYNVTCLFANRVGAKPPIDILREVCVVLEVLHVKHKLVILGIKNGPDLGDQVVIEGLVGHHCPLCLHLLFPKCKKPKKLLLDNKVIVGWAHHMGAL